MENLQERHIQALKSVIGGADVYSYETAHALRQVDKVYPGLVTIIPLDELEKIHGKKFDGTKALPYFGAITTAKGMKVIKDWGRRK